MSWWAVGITAAVGAYKGIKNEEKMAKNDKYRKAAIQYSPWTGMGDPGSQELPGVFDSALSGAATGAMISGAGDAGGGTTGATTGAAGTGAETALGNNLSLGGAEQAASLESLKFTPETAQVPQFDPAAAPGGAQASIGKYSAMGPQGSAGSLGTGGPTLNFGNQQDPNNPYLKYSLMAAQQK